MNITYSHDDMEQMRRHYESQMEAMKIALEVSRSLVDEAVTKAVRERTREIYDALPKGYLSRTVLVAKYPDCFKEDDQ